MARFIELKPNVYLNLDAVETIKIDTERSRIYIYVDGCEYYYSDVSQETIEKLKQLLNNN